MPALDLSGYREGGRSGNHSGFAGWYSLVALRRSPARSPSILCLQQPSADDERRIRVGHGTRRPKLQYSQRPGCHDRRYGDITLPAGARDASPRANGTSPGNPLSHSGRIHLRPRKSDDFVVFEYVRTRSPAMGHTPWMKGRWNNNVGQILWAPWRLSRHRKLALPPIIRSAVPRPAPPVLPATPGSCTPPVPPLPRATPLRQRSLGRSG